MSNNDNDRVYSTFFNNKNGTFISKDGAYTLTEGETGYVLSETEGDKEKLIFANSKTGKKGEFFIGDWKNEDEIGFLYPGSNQHGDYFLLNVAKRREATKAPTNSYKR